jgi:hypothetical protein
MGREKISAFFKLQGVIFEDIVFLRLLLVTVYGFNDDESFKYDLEVRLTKTCSYSFSHPAVNI